MMLGKAKLTYQYQNSLKYFKPPQCGSQAVECVSTPRMYPQSRYFLILYKSGSNCRLGIDSRSRVLKKCIYSFPNKDFFFFHSCSIRFIAECNFLFFELNISPITYFFTWFQYSPKYIIMPRIIQKYNFLLCPTT